MRGEDEYILLTPAVSSAYTAEPALPLASSLTRKD